MSQQQHVSLTLGPSEWSNVSVVERSVSSIDLTDSLDKSIGMAESMGQILHDRSARPAMILVLLLVSFAILELVYMKWSNSLALVASAFFDLVDAVVLFVGIWGHVVTKNRADFMHSYGFERFEVIARFATSTYFVFVCLWVFFEGIERILEVEPTFIHGVYLVHIGVAGIVLQLVHTVVFRKYALNARTSLTAGSPVFALGWEFLADFLVMVTGFFITHRGYMLVDTFVALILTTLIAYQMIPVMKESALILLQSTPSTLPVAKMLREVSTIDGVLEVRKEHFWSVGATAHVGTLRVRVRSEVSESAVLSKITALCEPYVRHLTVQVEKDSWEMKRL